MISCNSVWQNCQNFHRFLRWISIMSLHFHATCNMVFARDFLFTLLCTRQKAELFLPSDPSFSRWIKMSLAVQLWLTAFPNPAEQLPLFDESGPVCFPAPPVVWCMTALPLKVRLYSTQGKREAEQAAVFSSSSSVPPPFHRAPQNIVEKKERCKDECHGFFFFLLERL